MSYSLTVTESGGLTLGLTGPAGPAGPAGPVATPLVRSTAPISSTMNLSGSFSDGTSPIDPSAFAFVYSGFYGGKPQYLAGVGDNISWIPSDSAWFIVIDGFAWYSFADVTTPDLVPSGAWNATTNPNAWRPSSPATGTPIVTESHTAASFLGQMTIVSVTDTLYACTRLSPVKWTLLSNP